MAKHVVTSSGSHRPQWKVIALLILMATLLFAQGGFFPFTTCVCGSIAGALSFLVWVKHREKTLPLTALFVLGTALAYLISALSAGVTLTTLAEAASWAAVAAFALLASVFDESERAQMLAVVAWTGIVTAIIGVLVAGRLVPVAGMLEGDRLQFTFQYANAAGAWFGACAYLCLLSNDARLRSATLLPLLAMLLTQSGGSVLVFAIVAFYLVRSMTNNEEWRLLASAIVETVVAVVAFLTIQAGIPALSLLAIVFACGSCVLVFRNESNLLQLIGTKRMCLTGLAVVAASGVVSAAALAGRLMGAASNLVERGYQVADALRLWVRIPLLGIGPDNWQYHVHLVQSAQYSATIVHCSYAQVLVDAGVIGFFCLLIAGWYGMRRLVEDGDADRGWAAAELAAALFMMMHAFLDFDLRFRALAALLVLLLCGPGGRSVKVSRFAMPAFSLACLPLCFAGIACAVMSSALSVAVATGDYEAAARLYERNALAWHDGTAQGAYIEALVASDHQREAVALYRSLSNPSDRSTLCAAVALYEEGDAAAGGVALVERLEKQPYDTALFRGTKRIFDERGLDESVVKRYRKAVKRANKLMWRTSKLLPERHPVSRYKINE